MLNRLLKVVVVWVLVSTMVACGGGGGGRVSTTVNPTVNTTKVTPMPSCVPASRTTLTVNVKDTGAKGDGVTDDTKAIQAAVNQVAGTGGTVFVPNGIYMVEPLSGRVNLQSNMTLRLSSGAVIKAIGTASASYNLVSLRSVSNVNIVGGTIQGDRNSHILPAGITVCGSYGDPNYCGEHGMDIGVYGSSNIVIENLTTKDAWGDGIYIGTTSSRVKVCSVISDNNRRQGLTITSANDVIVKNSIFKNTNGTAPEAGIDIETNANETVANVTILNSQFLNNQGAGLVASTGSKANTVVTNITADGNKITGNGHGRYKEASLYISGPINSQFTNNQVTGGGGDGVILVNHSTGVIVKKNVVTDNNGFGIDIYQVSNNVITGNIFTNNKKYGLDLWTAPNNIVTYNTGTGNVQGGLNEFPLSSNTLAGNNFH